LFLNLGFSDLNQTEPALQLAPEDEIYRLAIQLYHHVLGNSDLVGQSILEVGCGCGGGASYLMRSRRPASLIGVDYLQRHIEICRKQHQIPGLSFCPGDAERLPFPDQTFDGVLNIESSHSYNSMERFLSEVKRVLRPSGIFWFADLRPTNDEWGQNRNLAALQQQLKASGLQLLSQTNITENVLAAMDSLETAKQMMLDMNHVGGANRRHFEEIMLCQGSDNYAKLKNGDWEYWSFTLLK
jgi:ubiquinone/menaquinone biosynthesis C-methylase UbiE